MYVCLSVCMHVCIYVYMYVCMYIYIHTDRADYSIENTFYSSLREQTSERAATCSL